VTAVRVYLTAAIGAMGLVVGYLAQRSRMCFVAGFRDYLLVRDRELLLGFFSFFLTVWLLTTALYSLNLLKKGAPEYGEPRTGETVGGVPASADGEPRAGVTAVVAAKPQAGQAEPSAGPSDIAGGGPEERASRGRRLAVGFVSAPFTPDRFVFVSLAGGWIVGLLSTFAGGCVLRQHVLAAQGGRDSSWYLAGFYAAVPVFYLLLSRLISSIY
jgi:hypothetical protein